MRTIVKMAVFPVLRQGCKNLHLYMDIDLIRDRIRIRRKVLGYTQEYMANKLNISVNAYGELESGSTKIINLRVLEIAEILEDSLEHLLFGGISESDCEERLKSMEEEFLKKIEGIHTQYQIKIKELEGANEELKVTLKTKDGIIGVLKEKLPNY